MTVYTRAQAVARALKSRTYPQGMCYRWTREQFGLPSVGDRDGDGDADAVDGWRAAKHRHPSDRHPPAGVPVFWSGGSKGHGHAAISLGNGRIRSIDAAGFGNVGTVDLGWVERTWGLRYSGWSEDLGGTLIPNPPPADHVRLVTANMNLYRGNDEAQLRYLDRLVGRGLVLMQERLGIGRRSTVIRRVGILTRNLPRWGIGRVGAHKYVARSWIRVNGVPVRVFDVHGLHRKTNGDAAADALLRTLGRRIKYLNRLGLATVVGGDFNTKIDRAADLIGGTGHGTGIDGFVVSSHLEVTNEGVDRYGLNTGLTDHPYYWIDVRAKRKAN